MKKDPIFDKVELTARQKKQLQSVLKEVYEFFKPYYDQVGLKLTKKDAESIRYNVVILAKKLRRCVDEREIDND